MPGDDHKRLVMEYIDRVWNQGDVAALNDLTDPGFTYHLGEQAPRSRDGMRQFLSGTRSAFPDWRVEVADIIAEGGLVAVRWLGTVTHEGPFHGIAPTGRRIRVSGMNLYRIVEGKVAQEWEQTDSLSMLQQLGAL